MPTEKPDTDLTVEQALSDLRDLLGPQTMVDVHMRTGPCAKYARVSTMAHMWDAPTLSEVITKIRNWKDAN